MFPLEDFDGSISPFSFNHRGRRATIAAGTVMQLHKPLGGGETQRLRGLRAEKGRGRRHVCKSHAYSCVSQMRHRTEGFLARHAQRLFKSRRRREVEEAFSYNTSETYSVPSGFCQRLERSEAVGGWFSTSQNGLLGGTATGAR